RKCSFLWEYRSLPDADPSEIITRFTELAESNVLPPLRAIFPGARIEPVTRAQAPGRARRDGQPGETLALKLAHCNAAEAVSYNTEAGLFQLADIPTVVCGPGDIAQAHKPDEFISLSQVKECEAFMQRLADHVSGKAI